MTKKFEVTIIQPISNGYDTWQRGVLGIGTVLNQFCRFNPDILRHKLEIMNVGDEYEYKRTGDVVHFHRVE